jgi:hypothetical protein
MTVERFCACPCKASLDGMKPTARYATAACRTRHYRERKLAGEQTPRVTSQRRNTKPSGLQISFWKAQKALEDFLGLHDATAPRNLSLRILEDALSDKQRHELHARKRAKRAPTLTVAEQRDALEQEDQAA